MKLLQTTLKGWLTKLSLSTALTTLLVAQNTAIPAFIEASNTPTSWVLLGSAFGTLWGLIRPFTPAYYPSTAVLPVVNPDKINEIIADQVNKANEAIVNATK